MTLNISSIECGPLSSWGGFSVPLISKLHHITQYNHFTGNPGLECDTTLQSLFRRALEVPSSVVRKVVTEIGERSLSTIRPEKYPKYSNYRREKYSGLRIPGYFGKKIYEMLIPGYEKEKKSLYKRTSYENVLKVYKEGIGKNFIVARYEFSPGGCKAIGLKLEEDDTGVYRVIYNFHDSEHAGFRPTLTCDVERSKGSTTLNGEIVDVPHTVARCHGVFQWGPCSAQQSFYESTEIIRGDGDKAPYEEERCDGYMFDSEYYYNGGKKIPPTCVKKSGSKTKEESLLLFDEWEKQYPLDGKASEITRKLEKSKRSDRFTKAWQEKTESDFFKEKLKNYTIAAAGITSSIYCFYRFHRAYKNLSAHCKKGAEERTDRISKIGKVAAWALAGIAGAGISCWSLYRAFTINNNFSLFTIAEKHYHRCLSN